jgi:hypothetical protein
MTALRSSVVLTLTVVMAAVSASGAVAVSAQQPAGMLSNWGDLETWSRYDERRDESEVGLGLQPMGKMGPKAEERRVGKE